MLRHLVNNLGPLLSTTKPAGRTGVCLSTRTTSPSASSHPARARNAAGKFIRTATLAPCGGHSSDSTNAPRTLTSRVRPCDSRACPRSIHRNTTGTSSGYRTAVRCFARGGALCAGGCWSTARAIETMDSASICLQVPEARKYSLMPNRTRGRKSLVAKHRSAVVFVIAIAVLRMKIKGGFP